MREVHGLYGGARPGQHECQIPPNSGPEWKQVTNILSFSTRAGGDLGRLHWDPKARVLWADITTSSLSLVDRVRDGLTHPGHTTALPCGLDMRVSGRWTSPLAGEGEDGDGTSGRPSGADRTVPGAAQEEELRVHIGFFYT